MKSFLKKFEDAVIKALIVMMVVVVLISTIELGWIIIKDVITPPVFFLEIPELKEIFGFFLLIVIGVELLETIKAYLDERVIHIEIVLEVALIAIARKVIILDMDKYPGSPIFGIAALILSLVIAFFVIKRIFKDRKYKSGRPLE
jgi:uncharacterized membrane protein (DUF373 family)